LVQAYLDEYETYVGVPFPDNLNDQLQDSIVAVFKSWNCERAVKYRAVHNIPDNWGTAVNIQQMVFGNANAQSCAGVLFTRNPDSGASELYGDWLPEAQGEDVVAGIRNTHKIEDLKSWSVPLYNELAEYAVIVEKHYTDMQDMEFTVESGKLYILQTRRGARSAAAAFRIAHNMAEEGLITKTEAIKRVNGKQYLILNKPQIDKNFKKPADMTGIPAAGTIATGIAVFSASEAEKCKEPCILIANETTPEDFGGMAASVGILTRIGGVTSHAAVVARGMDKTCVVGCTELEMTSLGAIIPGGGPGIVKGTKVTMDGATGRVWIGQDVPVLKQKIDQHVREIIKWALDGSISGDTLVKITPETTQKQNEAVWGQDFELQLPASGKVYIDCSRIADKPRWKLSKLIDVLKSRTDLTGIIGLGQEPVPVQDVAFLGFLGLEADLITDADKEILGSQIKALLVKKCTLELKKRWTLHLPTFVGGDQCETLRAANWQQVRPIKTLGDLMEVDGMLDIDEATETRLKKTEGVDLKKFIALLNKAGQKAERLPRAVAKDRMIFEVLGK
jgi:pyruvate,phosphate dikinase